MATLEKAEKLLAQMTRAEKAQLLQWVVRDLGDAFPGIESRPEVCGGEPCIVRTRIPVWLLVQAKRLNTSEADLLRAYPALRAEDLANAWAYYRAHSDEIERQIRENEAADPDFSGQAQRIHDAVEGRDSLAGQIVRVNRPGP